jgi:tyrosinase
MMNEPLLTRGSGRDLRARVNVLAEALDAAASDRPPHEAIGLDRQQFLKLTAGLMSLGFLGLTPACGGEVLSDLLDAITNRPVRRDISSLAPDDPIITAYADAVRKMRALPNSDRRNWTSQAQIHQDVCRHRSWLFFPWHRAYVLYFERICRELSGDASFALPYWNWTANPQIPAVFFDQSSPLYHANRVATQTSTANSSSVGPGVVNPMLDEPNFLIFGGGAVAEDSTAQFGSSYGIVEQTPHNYIHVFVGGTMATFMAPLDPIFWVHHNQIEHLWVQWNLTRGHPNTNDSAWANTDFIADFCDKDGNDVNETVALLLLAPLLSYRYDTQ